MRSAVDEVGSRVPVIAPATGGTAQATAQAVAAQHAGAVVILLMPPYLTEAGQAGLIAHISAVCQVTDLGVIVYSRANAVLEDDTVAELAERCPNLIGLEGRRRRHQAHDPHVRQGRRPPHLHRRPADSRDLRIAPAAAGREHLLVGDLQLRPAFRPAVLRGGPRSGQGLRLRDDQRLHHPLHRHPQPRPRLRGLHHQSRPHGGGSGCGCGCGDQRRPGERPRRRGSGPPPVRPGFPRGR
ncbi:hypothetical protein QFZ76_007518 [Streptomyces sp. V4I2]|nr:hypothetical protein [Streptomyces sp. V4I2]